VVPLYKQRSLDSDLDNPVKVNTVQRVPISPMKMQKSVEGEASTRQVEQKEILL